MLSSFCRAALIVLLFAWSVQADDGPGAIATGGSGTLTMCRNWILFSTCRNYNKVELPARIAVGDRLPLNFGSNPKDYEFPVARITRSGEACTLLTAAADPAENANKIEVPSCQDASGTH